MAGPESPSGDECRRPTLFQGVAAVMILLAISAAANLVAIVRPYDSDRWPGCSSRRFRCSSFGLPRENGRKPLSSAAACFGLCGVARPQLRQEPARI
jgi:hypothetical protein